MNIKSKFSAFLAVILTTTAIALASDMISSAETPSVIPQVEEAVAPAENAITQSENAPAVEESNKVCHKAACNASESRYAQDHKHDMTHKMTVLAFQIGIILFAARLGGMLAEKVNLPSVLGELGAGIVIGPFALGKIPLGHFFHYGLFPEWSAEFAISPELYGICSIASIVLLFLAGVETDLKMFMRYSLAGSIVGIGGVILSFVAGDVLAVLLLHKIGLADSGLSFLDPAPLFLGIMSTATSVGITARILSERKKIDSEEGVTIMAGAVIDDVLGIIILAIGLGVIGSKSGADSSASIDWAKIGIIAAKAFGVWLISTIIGIIAAHRISGLLKTFKSPLSIATMALGLALILSGFFETMGLAMIIGAYVMGLALSKTDIRYVIHENLHAVYTFLVPIFFCVMGMMVDLHALVTKEVLIFGGIYTVLAVLAKLFGCCFPAMACGFNFRGGMRIGAGMIPRGEVALIVAGIGMSQGFLSKEIFGIGILMTLVTTLVAPTLLIKLFSSDASGLRKPKVDEEKSKGLDFELPTAQAAEMMCEKLLTEFRREGFFTHTLSIKDCIWQVRKDEMEIGITRDGNKILFECTPTERNFVATAVLEVTADLAILANALRKPITTENISRVVNEKEGMDAADNTITKYINSFVMCPYVESDNKNAIIRKLCHILFEKGLISDFEETIKAVLAREEVMSTGLENGIAIPHARVNTVQDLVGVVAIVHDGVKDYNTIDNSTVKIVILTLSPEDANTPHLRMISHVGKVLDAQGCEKIINAKTEQAMREVLLG